MAHSLIQLRLSTYANIIIIYNVADSQRPVVAQRQSVTVKPTGCEFNPHSKIMKYLLKFIFPFLRSGVEDKRGVEFCHSTRNASRFGRMGEWSVLTLGSLCLPRSVRDIA